MAAVRRGRGPRQGRGDFPGFDEAIVSDLRTSLDLFLQEVVWSEDSDYRELLLAGDLL